MLGIAGYVLMALLICHKNLVVPETRGVALLGFATLLSVAVGYELSVRGFASDWVLPVVLAIPAATGSIQAWGHGCLRHRHPPVRWWRQESRRRLPPAARNPHPAIW